MSGVLSLKSTLLLNKVAWCNVSAGSKRSFYNWLIVIFNRRDLNRVEKFGPDRVAAEWILRNEGAVRFVGQERWLANYNAIPDGPPGKFFVEGINGRNASLANNGLEHFVGLKHLKYVDINGSKFISDLTHFKEVADTLEYLDIGNCAQISDVSHLSTLNKLKTLVLSNTLGKGREAVIDNLRNKLSSCEIIDDASGNNDQK